MTRRLHARERLHAVRGRAVAYIRVSTDKQADAGVSLEAQEARTRGMVAVQEADLIDVIVDAGESAKSLHRPGMTRLLALVDARAVDTVIVAKLDRLTRSVRDLADLLERFAKRGVTLVSVAESLDTGTAAGRLVLNVMMSVAQWEREAISERTRDAMRHKKAMGHRVGTVAYGYRVAGDGRLEEAPDEQAVLRRMRELRASGLSYQKISDTLNAEDRRTRRGSRWQFQYVQARIGRDDPGAGYMSTAVACGTQGGTRV